MRYTMILLLLSGCSSQIMLQNPKTGEIAKCSSSNVDYVLPSNATESCAKAYEKSGWMRIDSY